MSDHSGQFLHRPIIPESSLFYGPPNFELGTSVHVVDKDPELNLITDWMKERIPRSGLQLQFAVFTVSLPHLSRARHLQIQLSGTRQTQEALE
jgi:hypothetical protein